MKLNVVLYIALALISASTFANESVLVWDDSNGFEVRGECEAERNASIAGSKLAKHVDSIIEVTDFVPVAQSSPFPLVGSFWQSSRNEKGYEVLKCANDAHAEYLVFSVHLPARPSEVTKVGVSLDSAEIFKFIRSHSKEDAEEAFATSGTPTPIATASVRVQASEGTMSYVVCTSAERLNVRDESLSKILFQVAHQERAKIVQSFSTDEIEKTIDGKAYTFIKVQFPDRASSTNIGFVAEEFIKLTSECPRPASSPDDVTTEQAWTFPTLKRASQSYKGGMRRFKASRGGGSRWHAACDLYRVTGEAAASVTTGKVIRDRYYFYEGTYALEVRHTGGKVVRYGEITGKAAPGVSLNRNVTTGQTLGYIGKVNSGCCEPMLHFEMYSGTATGALTQGGNKFNRRKDLIDPTSYLTGWEKAKFGTSY